MPFTKLNRIQSYTDVLCIGIAVDSQKYAYGENDYIEKIHGFHSIHLRNKNNHLHQHGDIIEWNTDTLFDSIINYTDCRRNTLVVCNNTLVAIGSSDFTDMLECNEIIIHETNKVASDFGLHEKDKVSTECFIASCPPTILIIKHLLTGNTYTLVDIANYGARYMYDIYTMLDNKDKQTVNNIAEIGVSEDSSLTCCSLIAKFMQHYHNIVIQHKLGGLSLTYASQAMRAFRYQFYDNNIVDDTDKASIMLVRQCYLGGRVEELYHGSYKNKVYLLDCQSLYPYIGTTKPFPTECILSEGQPSKVTVEEHIDTHIIFAHCYVKDAGRYLPVKYQGSLIFPTGDYHCYLCGDEFREAYKNGIVNYIHSISVFKCDLILKPYSEYMLGLRTKYKGSNDRISEYIVKLITNGLWGKFGQIPNCWIIDDDAKPDRPYGGYIRHDRDTGQQSQHRIIDWIVSKLSPSLVSENMSVPIAAIVNSHSRFYLWKLMEQAGLHNVLYTCVDGLIVTQEGFERLSHSIARNPYEYGRLKISEQDESCNLIGYGTYKIGNKIAHQGIPKYNSKQYRGFWSAVQQKAADQLDEIDTGHAVKTTLKPTDIRNKLRSPESDYGYFMAPYMLEESMHDHTPHTHPQQGELFHAAEWQR